MARDLEGLTERLLDAARKAGAEAADAIAVAGDSLSIEVRGGALEQAERAEGVDIGLRVLIGRRQACVSSSDVRPDTIAAMAERAVAMAREAPEDPWCGLADPGQLARDWDLAALDLADPAPAPSPADLEAAARAAEAAALAVPGVSQDGRGRRRLAVERGASGRQQRLFRRLRPDRAFDPGGGDQRRGPGDGARLCVRARASTPPTCMSPEEIGRLAGERAVACAGAEQAAHRAPIRCCSTSASPPR